MVARNSSTRAHGDSPSTRALASTWSWHSPLATTSVARARSPERVNARSACRVGADADASTRPATARSVTEVRAKSTEGRYSMSSSTLPSMPSMRRTIQPGALRLT